MATPTIYLYVLVPVLAAIVYLYRTANRAGLRDIPGPTIARYTNLWNLRNTASGSAEVGFVELHKKYGPIVRTGPNNVDLTDPEAIPLIYGIQSKFVKSKFYSVFAIEEHGVKMEDLFSTQDRNIHKVQKRNSSNAYAMSSMVGLESLVDESAQIFFEKLERMEDGPVNLGEWLQWYAFDVIGQITFSKRFGFMEQGKDISDMINQIEKGLMYSAVIGQYPSLHHSLFLGNPYTMWIFKNVPALAQNNPLIYFSTFAQDQIRKHSEKADLESSTTKDFLTRLREQQKQSTTLTDGHVLTNCLTNLLAGSDTTAISLRAIIYMLIKNPYAYQKLQKEIDDLEDQGKLSSLISFSESQGMPYLQACMKEAMRLHPVVGLPLERVVPKGGATLSGHTFPEGTIVGMNAWVVHKDKTIFGDDAEEFRPERWIESDEETLKLMNRSFLSFGHGARTCIGKNISILEMSKVVPQLFRKYDIAMATPGAELRLQNYWLVRQSGLICKFTPRKRVIGNKSAQV